MAFVVLLLGSSGPAAAAVFGRDERMPVPDRLASVARQIGLLYDERTRSVCTAFCLRRDLIATAAHCLFRGAGRSPPALSSFTFVIKRGDPASFSRIAGHGRPAVRQSVVAGTTDVRVRPPIDASSDWAIVRLARPVCTRGGLPIAPLGADEIAKRSLEGQLFQIAYHRDYGNWRPAYSKPCDVRRTFGEIGRPVIERDFSNVQSLILHRCPTGGASSGSPLLIEGPAGPAVVGINVGTYVLSRIIERAQSGKKPRVEQYVVANTGVNASVFLGQISALANTLPLESEGLRALQADLQALDLYRGRLDGRSGPLLKAAIEQFERAQGLPVTGQATERLAAAVAAVVGPGSARASFGTTHPASGSGAPPAERAGEIQQRR
jgi:protease YdgD